MWRYITLAVSVAVFAAFGPSMLQQKLEEKPPQEPVLEASAAAPAAKTLEVRRQQDNPSAGRSTRISSDGRGHFIASARLNGVNAEVLVDTGATAVAINESMARRLGIQIEKNDFKHPVRTANGIIYSASVVIDSVEIGRVRAENVYASVLKDDALDGVLLGMSFLGKLKRFEVANGELVLTQ